MTWNSGTPSSRAISPTLGSRPSRVDRSRRVRTIRLTCSTMWTGMRMVRAWSAMARVMAWRNHQAKVGLQEVVLGGAPLAGHGHQVARELGLADLGQHFLGVEPGLDALGQLDFLRGGEQLGPADPVEVRANQIGGRAAVVAVEIGRLVAEVHRLDLLVVATGRGEGLGHGHSPPRARS